MSPPCWQRPTRTSLPCRRSSAPAGRTARSRISQWPGNCRCPSSPPFQMAQREDGGKTGHDLYRPRAEAFAAPGHAARQSRRPGFRRGRRPPPRHQRRRAVPAEAFAAGAWTTVAARAKSNAYSTVSGGAVGNALKPAPTPPAQRWRERRGTGTRMPRPLRQPRRQSGPRASPRLRHPPGPPCRTPSATPRRCGSGWSGR